MIESDWTTQRYFAFEFRGATGTPAITDLTVLRRGDETPVVIATERDDNTGFSITNGAEKLGAAILTRLFPDRVGESEPFVLIEHHEAKSFNVGRGDFEGIGPTFRRVTFADFEVRNGARAPQIGDVVKWEDVSRRLPQTQQLATQQRVDQTNSMAQEESSELKPSRGLRLAR